LRQLGFDPDHLPRQTVAAQLGAPWAGGTLSLNYLRRLNQGEALARVLNLSYSRRFSAAVFGALTLVRPLSSDNLASANLVVTVMLDPAHVASSTLNRQAGASSLRTDFQRAMPASGDGAGYRLAATQGSGIQRQEASVTRRQAFGVLGAELVRQDPGLSSRLSARGSVNMIGGGVHFSSASDGGFALVRTPGMAGVPILLENQVVAHTDASGQAMVGNLRPYESNHISVDPLALPMDATVGEIDAAVVPRRRGGVLVEFDVHVVQSATLLIRMADGKAMPPWTPVQVEGVTRSFVSGLRGEVFVELPVARRVHVRAQPLDTPPCELWMDHPDDGAMAPVLGPGTCIELP
jgi:outer membrane usher protein